MEQEIKKVKIKHGTAGKLAEIFNVTIQTVNNATSGRWSSELSRKIRKAAVEMGGDPIYESNNI
jgi:hypothetical protein